MAIDQLTDWPWPDVKAALEKQGTNLNSLCRQHGRRPRTLAMVKNQCWHAGQVIIAEAIGVPPHIIWPSRYLSDGSPKTGPVRRNISTECEDLNVQNHGAA